MASVKDICSYNPAETLDSVWLKTLTVQSTVLLTLLLHECNLSFFDLNDYSLICAKQSVGNKIRVFKRGKEWKRKPCSLFKSLTEITWINWDWHWFYRLYLERLPSSNSPILLEIQKLYFQNILRSSPVMEMADFRIHYCSKILETTLCSLSQCTHAVP